MMVRWMGRLEAIKRHGSTSLFSPAPENENLAGLTIPSQAKVSPLGLTVTRPHTNERFPLNNVLDITPEAESDLIAGARDAKPVSGLTHTFYKYPARFSGSFASAAIRAFTNPGDLVVDPHVGGGTTLVEAMAHGCDAIGVDISSLAEFVSLTKTTIYDDRELEVLTEWAKRLPSCVNLKKPSVSFPDYFERGYYKHLDHANRWRVRKAIEQALGSALTLPGRLEDFGRCVVLRTAQTALDGRKKTMRIPNMREMLGTNATEMIESARRFRLAATRHGSTPSATVLHRTAAGLEDDERLATVRAPRLVVTSPPYPGVHVLYHRWQVGGGRETAAPFWIAKKLDGSGASYYTMGDRKAYGIYFEKIQATMTSVATISDADTIVVQMLAFGEPEWQLPRYLKSMEAAGLIEVFLPSLVGERDGRLWRSVPNRKWYSDQRGETPGSQEVVLLHRKRTSADRRSELGTGAGVTLPSAAFSAE